MKKNFSFYNILCLVCIATFYACADKGDKTDLQQDSTIHIHDETKVYYCPMHPEVVSDKPGICPKCGMDLELRPQSEKTDTLAFLIQPTNHAVLSDLKVITPSDSKESQRIEADGYLTYNPENAISIAAKVSGRIEHLYVTYNFQRIRKGQKLLDLYSPELLTVQNEYIAILHAGDSTDLSIIKGLKEKLILLGMTETDVKALTKTSHVSGVVPVYSTTEGHVHFLSDNTNMEAHALSWPSNDENTMDTEGNKQEQMLRQGTYVNKGDNLATISKDEGVWALLKIKPVALAQVRQGNAVELYINGEVHTGKIDFIERSFKSGTDFYTARVYLSGTHHNNLTIGNLVHAYISPFEEADKIMRIPASAVVNLGKSQGAVFIKSSPGFTAKKIQTGEYTSEWVEVISGLSNTDSIATIASYLVDSEAFIITDKP